MYHVQIEGLAVDRKTQLVKSTPTGQRPVITVYGAGESSFLTMLLSGLSDLRAQGLIELRYDFAPSLTIASKLESFALWLLIEHGQPEGGVSQCKRETLAYFDLLDDPNIADEVALAKADIYFKRSFSAEVVSRLPQNLACKMSAMPLHFGVRGPAHGAGVRVRRAKAGGNWAGEFPQALRRSAAALLRDVPFADALGVKRLPPVVGEFEAEKGTVRDQRIYFRTRLYNIDTARNDEIAEALHALNSGRIALIRALREAFGPVAFAGLYESHGSGKFAPELLRALPGNARSQTDHLRYSRQFLINVNSVGVAGSNGWKLAEILGGGSALVTEQLCYEHLDPLRDGVEMAGFKTPDECVAQCEKLLADPELAESIRSAGLGYFNRCLHPDAAMARILGVVYSRG